MFPKNDLVVQVIHTPDNHSMNELLEELRKCMDGDGKLPGSDVVRRVFFGRTEDYYECRLDKKDLAGWYLSGSDWDRTRVTCAIHIIIHHSEDEGVVRREYNYWQKEAQKILNHAINYYLVGESLPLHYQLVSIRVIAE